MAAKPDKGAKDGKGRGKSPKGGKDGKGKLNPSSAGPHEKPGPSQPKSSDLTPAQKADMPCIYFAQGKCFREKCPFKHDPQAKGAPAAKAASKSKPLPAKPGLVALIAASISAATATTIPANSGPHFIDFMGDTGAGDWLGSRTQGIRPEVMDSWIGPSAQPLRFTTGGGLSQRLPLWVYGPMSWMKLPMYTCWMNAPWLCPLVAL